MDAINAARTVLKHCNFDAIKCADGIEALRNWSFKYSEDNRSFSAEPEHNWASHGADAFAEGAKMLQVMLPAKAPEPIIVPDAPMYSFGNLDSLWESHSAHLRQRQRRVG
jgi:hypothetical protein